MLSTEEVRRIAHLARIELTDDEVERTRLHLGRVIEYVQELETVTAGATEGMVRHVPRDCVAYRGDRVLPFAHPEALLHNAPVLEQSHFAIPTTVVERS